MLKRLLSFSKNVFAITFISVILVATILIFNNYHQQLRLYERQELSRLDGIATTLVLQIDGDLMDSLYLRYPEKDDIPYNEFDTVYMRIHDILHNTKDANNLGTQIYTMMFNRSDSLFCFGISSADEPFWRHTYTDFPSELLDQYEVGGVLPSYSDTNGTWLSAFKPIRNSSEKVVGIVQVDERFDSFISEAQKSIFSNTLISLVVTSLIAVVIYLLLRTFYRIQSKLDAEKQEIEQLRIELFANVSHDLRTPLASIQGYLETVLMKRDSISPEKLEKYLAISLHNTEKLKNLVDELFELSKLQSKERKINRESFSLSELTIDVVANHRLTAASKNVDIIELIPRDLPMVFADLALIDRVLNNLLSNAVKFTNDGQKVTIELKDIGSEICVTIADNGIGISEEDLPKIFDRFHTRPAGNSIGTGLGLAIVKSILELHGGKYDVQSAIGKGTTFMFCLPKA
ncbi:MAG: HAMP domain-containing histidine kinase [Flavobacteriales bacterium]|nr:HAMP domain-containing histidine kinase [Flavobacteriales bacterium]